MALPMRKAPNLPAAPCGSSPLTPKTTPAAPPPCPPLAPPCLGPPTRSQTEAASHNDTVVVRGADSYRNLPNKTLRTLRYAMAHPAGGV